MPDYDKLRNLVTIKPEEAIKRLLQIPDKDKNILLLTKAKFELWKKYERLELISHKDLMIDYSKVINALLFVINSFEKGDSNNQNITKKERIIDDLNSFTENKVMEREEKQKALKDRRKNIEVAFKISVAISVSGVTIWLLKDFIILILITIVALLLIIDFIIDE